LAKVIISVTQTVAAPLGVVFKTAAGIDPRALVQKYGPLPGIANVEGQTGAWSAVGQKRRLILTDKTLADEELVAFTPNETFAYRAGNYTGVFKSLVMEAHGRWHFTTLASDKTQIDWTYTFIPTGPIQEAVLWFIVKLFWPGYLRAALARVKLEAEKKLL